MGQIEWNVLVLEQKGRPRWYQEDLPVFVEKDQQAERGAPKEWGQYIGCTHSSY